ncbi:hypothetical protein ROZALSC1DRAFT_27409 [Rozella allomycis CSF55]|uniref:Uncharacterized protein n=1 Tax=Rozella allomycis (strain CSF55) TaxID=988480 RepID=A0A4P9YNI1_ROZAC|nr:hypothetical protein ROZALSC1DRAFT_27405 [Rozella allomycis CSF55]RKP21160.1 hypothetical protein ROZALSC1DRAFT_27409 [Rozella allomycis CSF55]
MGEKEEVRNSADKIHSLESLGSPNDKRKLNRDDLVLQINIGDQDQLSTESESESIKKSERKNFASKTIEFTGFRYSCYLFFKNTKTPLVTSTKCIPLG